MQTSLAPIYEQTEPILEKFRFNIREEGNGKFPGHLSDLGPAIHFIALHVVHNWFFFLTKRENGVSSWELQDIISINIVLGIGHM